MDERFRSAREFMLTHARLLERRVSEVCFDDAPASCVADALRAYRNPDGGLGHALEPDLRCPESQPLFAEIGLAALCDVEYRDQDLALSICAFLQSVADDQGLVPPLLKSALTSPRAPHWAGLQPAGLNPTIGICGLLHYQRVEHDWLAWATETCCEMALKKPPLDAHTLAGACRLAEHHPDKRKATQLTEIVAAALPKASFFIPEAPVEGYGLTPLHFAPTPDSPWRSLFKDHQIQGHLDDLLVKQQEDGGWPISWMPPGPAAHCEWRGWRTLEAISTLAAYGRVER